MKILSEENPLARFFILYSLPFLVIGVISRTFPIINPVYYIVPVLLIINILLALILLPRNDINLNYFFIIFVYPVYCLITSGWSLIPLISLQRSLYLLLMYAGILSSVLLYKKFFPDKGIGFLIPANIIILIISAISLVFGIPSQSWSGGNGLGFMGFAGHQNILAAALFFTLPGVMALGIGHRAKGKEQSAKRNKYSYSSTKISSNFSPLTSLVFRLSSYFLLLTSNLLLLFLTYSRASILALAIGIITYLLITKSKKKLSFLLSIAAIFLVFYFTIPFIQHSINGLLNKDGGKILDRRMILWEPSLEASKMGGVFGLGYGVSAPGIITPKLTGSHYEDGRYIREKGNSVLAMIEETGLIGLLLFLLPVIPLIRKFKIQNSKFKIGPDHSSFLIFNSSLAAMLVHAQFEGWWVGVGSIHLPIFCILLFTTLLQKKSEELKIRN